MALIKQKSAINYTRCYPCAFPQYYPN